jgi:glutamate N-acetyltransferase/amino-acid N-acetyltransferase
MKTSKVAGGVCAPPGFKAAAAACGLKSGGELDLCVLLAEERCPAAGTFTSNAFRAAPVLVTLEHLGQDGFLQAVVANAGNANAWTGERGMEDARTMAALTASELGLHPGDIAVASTGVIGNHLDMEKVERGIREAAAKLDAEGGDEAALAIMTTDTRPKQIAMDFGGFTVGGMVKGSGMIRPDMATMLAFITTDARVEGESLAVALKEAVDGTFNRISIDGCTSTNDMVLALAGGASGISLGAEELKEPLYMVCSELAHAIVEDGEGATRFVTVRVHEAATEGEAKKAAMAIADSPLVKTAMFGGDPNWGRVVQALGAAFDTLDQERVRIQIGGVAVADAGGPVMADTGELEAAMAGKEVVLDIFLGRGESGLVVWTCDLSYDYVKINADYHT